MSRLSIVSSASGARAANEPLPLPVNQRFVARIHWDGAAKRACDERAERHCVSWRNSTGEDLVTMCAALQNHRPSPVSESKNP